MLTISETLSLPNSYVTSTGALLAVRGAGKSNTAAVIAEEMFREHLPFVVIDPVGAWWGLRSAGDGKGPGLAVPIFGGSRGDLPLERGAGELVADLIVDQRLSCVLDLSRFGSEGDKKAFLVAFARRLYARNEDPLHLFLEEADDYIPQRPMRDEAQLLRAFENIVRRGRGRGIGITLITQRSAAIAKMVLTQTETLFAMRTTGPQDIKAIEAWVQYHQADQDILASLAGLEDGEAWVWSPHFLKSVKRVTIRRRWTFDSGATPKNVKAGQARPVTTLADVDLAALRGRMAETIEKAKADDPRELRQQIVELRRAATAGATAPPVIGAAPVVLEADLKRAEALFDRGVAAISAFDEQQRKRAADVMMRLEPVASALHIIYARIDAAVSAVTGRAASTERPLAATRTPQQAQRSRPSAPLPPPRPVTAVDGEPLSGPEQRILDAIAWLEGIGVEAPEQTAVAFLAGYTVGGGAFNNPRGRLRRRGFVHYQGDCLRLTESGRRVAHAPAVALTTQALHAHVLERLPGPEQRLLQPLLAAWPKALGDTELAEVSRYTAGSGAFNNPKGRLRSLGLIEYPQPREARARDLLFLELVPVDGKIV